MIQAIAILVIAALVAVDQLTKLAVVNNLANGGDVEVLFGLLRFRYVENTGAAFNSFRGQTTFLAIFTLVVIVAVLFILLTKKIKPGFLYWSLVVVAAGGIGNFIDRIFRGFVVDFIEPTFVDFAVFNFADCCVTVGAVLLIVATVYDMIKENKAYLSEKKSKDAGNENG